jgi:allantoate deiminase
VERIAKENAELVGTVGRIEARPGAINVIPGEVSFTIDVRAPHDEERKRAVSAIRAELESISRNRRLETEIELLQEFGSTACASRLMEQMARAVERQGFTVRRLPSGAGHDGMALAAIADICMLFVRCRGGISHSPLEAITEADAAAGARVLFDFIEHFRLPA